MKLVKLRKLSNNFVKVFFKLLYLSEKGMLQLYFGLFLQGLEDLQVVVLAEMFQAEPDRLLLPVLLLPSNRLLDQVRSVVAEEGEEPDGEVEARAPGLDGDDF